MYFPEVSPTDNAFIGTLYATSVNRSLLPLTTSTIDLGSEELRWANGYFRNGHFNGNILVSGGVVSADAVYGNNGGNWGVYGKGINHGIFGESGYIGIRGIGNYSGVYGQGDAYGVLGEGNSGVVAYGNNTGVFGVGGYMGVYGANSISGGYAGYFSGKVYASGAFAASDNKLKQNIRDFTSALDIITQLQPKQYEFRQDGNYKLMNLPQGHHYGLLAQDVEKILPDLVSDTKFETTLAHPPLVKTPKVEAISPLKQNTENVQAKPETIEFKALNYTELIPIIIKAIQEQEEIIEQQQQQINELKQTITKISSPLQSSLTINGAFLKQNAPNPFTKSTRIQCYIPTSVMQAKLVIYSSDGKQLKTLTLGNKGLNEMTINASELSSGQYTYSLFIDGNMIDSKNMILTK